MKLTTLLAGTLAATIAWAEAQPEVLTTVTVTLTTYTQVTTNRDSGTLTTTPGPTVKTYNTQALLGMLARAKQAQGQWPNTNFPAGAKLAVANDGWVVVDSANSVLADVADILSFSSGQNEIFSGSRDNFTGLASPSRKVMQLINIRFDDTAITGGNNLAFFLQGLATRTVTDTRPTSAGVYSETQTVKITGAAGEGAWGDGRPFVCTANISATGKATFGQTNAPAGFAPESVAGYAATIKMGTMPVLLMSWGADTWAQSGVAGDAEADRYCGGTYSYVKTGPNSAQMTCTDVGMFNWLGTTNQASIDIFFTSRTAALCVVTDGEDTFTVNASFTKPANLVPATLAGKTIRVATPNSPPATMAYAADGTFTESHNGVVTASGTYTLTQYSPTTAIIRQDFKDSQNAGHVVFIQALFSTPTSGRAFYSYYANPGYEANPDESALATFTVP